MKSIVSLLTFFCTILTINAQANSEIFLFDLETNTSKIELKNAKNLSNNEGYDNQQQRAKNNLRQVGRSSPDKIRHIDRIRRAH